MNLFAVELRALHGYLMKTPEVRSVDIQRQLPGTLTIRINERQAIARLLSQPLVLDRDGHVFRFKPAMAALPLITGWSLPGLPDSGRITDQPVLDALTLLDLCARPRWSAVRLQSIDVAHPEYLELRLAGGERVWFGRSRWEERLDKLTSILKTQAERGQPIAFLDLTVDRNIPVQVALPAGAEGWR
jgi:cell division septal protein FtsQ